LLTFHGSEELPDRLKQCFSENQFFQGAAVPSSTELDVDSTLEAKLSFL
jgi:hypothetical protein